LVKIGYELNYKVTLLHSFLAALLRFFLQALTWRGTVHLRLLLDANLHFRVQALELGASQELRNSNESAESVKSKHVHNYQLHCLRSQPIDVERLKIVTDHKKLTAGKVIQIGTEMKGRK
jgi:hypothetical protein